MNLAVVVTTYNRPDALALVLDGYLAQDARDFELIIADDGSTDDTRKLVEDYARRAPFPLRHLWQEDQGFRAGAARNRALASIRAEYIVFSDGDCVPSRDFVAQHARLAEPGYFLSGNRILLTEEFTGRVLQERLPLHAWGNGRWLAVWLQGGVNRLLPLIVLPDGEFRRRSPRRWEGVKTCNLSAWRADLMRVNGFDESYSGWGLEDSDLVIRLLHAGLQHKSARFAAPVFHLWHHEHDRVRLTENQQRLNAIIDSSRIEAAIGVARYL